MPRTEIDNVLSWHRTSCFLKLFFFHPPSSPWRQGKQELSTSLEMRKQTKKSQVVCSTSHSRDGLELRPRNKTKLPGPRGGGIWDLRAFQAQMPGLQGWATVNLVFYKMTLMNTNTQEPSVREFLLRLGKKRSIQNRVLLIRVEATLWC